MANDDEAQHLRNLQAIKRRRLRTIEEQIERYGQADAPTHLLVEHAELRQALGIVETVISSPIPASIGDDLGERHRFVAYLDELRQIKRIVKDLVEDSMDWRERISLRIIILFVVVIILAVSMIVLAVLLAYWIGRLSDGAAASLWGWP